MVGWATSSWFAPKRLMPRDKSIVTGDRPSACRHSVAAGLLAEVLLDEAVELILDAEPAVKMAHIVISYNSTPLASHGTEPKSSGRPLLVGAGPNTRTPSPLENFALDNSASG